MFVIANIMDNSKFLDGLMILLEIIGCGIVYMLLLFKLELFRELWMLVILREWGQSESFGYKVFMAYSIKKIENVQL